MTCAKHVLLLQEALTLCNADDRHGAERELDSEIKFLAGMISGLAYPFWVVDARFLLVRFEKGHPPSWIAKLDNADAARLGFALRLKKLAYIAVMSHQPAPAPPDISNGPSPRSSGPSAGAWTNFLADEHLAGPEFVSYMKSRRFRSLLEDRVPAALFLRWDAVADLAAVVWAQHVAILEYRNVFRIPAGSDRARQIDRLLSITDPTNDLEMFLLVRDTTEEGFCVQPPGLRPNEYADFAAGQLTLRQLYRIRPAFIFRTLLPRPTSRN